MHLHKIFMTKTKGISAIQPKKINTFRVAVTSRPPLWKLKSIAKLRKLKLPNDEKPLPAAENQLEAASTFEGVSIDRGDSPPLAQNRSKYTNQQIQDELDKLQRGSEVVKAEIQTLNSIRGSLLWLLNKATVFETQTNHTLASFDATK